MAYHLVDRAISTVLAIALVLFVAVLLAALVLGVVILLLKQSRRARAILRSCADHYERRAVAAARPSEIELGESSVMSVGSHRSSRRSRLSSDLTTVAEEAPCSSSPPQPPGARELTLVDSFEYREARTALVDAVRGRFKAMAVCSVASAAFTVAFLAGMFFLGWNLTRRSSAADTWHDAMVQPPSFPRLMGCGKCNAGPKTDAEIEACMEPCSSLAFVKEWEAFATKHEWKLVYFPSRAGEGQGAVNLSAWWLPADPTRLADGEIAPRIVVMHGLGSNNNHCGVQATCFLLRTMGFSCLTPSVRDYGLSGPSGHPDTVTWGFDYHLDVLGAWDYAREDPDGELGGRLPESQVGLMGFSRGAMDVANAFGLEARVPVVWIDSAPFTGLRGMVDASVRPYAGPLTPLLREPVAWAAGHLGGAPVDKYIPLEVLTGNCSSPRRRLRVTQGLRDNFVPISEGVTAVLFTSGLAECYDVTVYTPPTTCFGDGHHTYMWALPDDARLELCSFWSEAFHRDPGLCGLDLLPRLQRDRLALNELPPVPAYTEGQLL